MFGTYTPQDYKGVVGEYLAARQKRITSGEKTAVEPKQRPWAKAANASSDSVPLLNALYERVRGSSPLLTFIVALMVLALVALL